MRKLAVLFCKIGLRFADPFPLVIEVEEEDVHEGGSESHSGSKNNVHFVKGRFAKTFFLKMLPL